MIVVAEQVSCTSLSLSYIAELTFWQLCVKREMRTDLEISFKPVATDEAGEEIEMNRV